MPLEGPRRKGQDNIKMGRQERGRQGIDRTHLAQESGGLL